jgi:hypothetical protein
MLKQLTVLMNQGGALAWAVAGVGGFGILFALFVLFGSLLRAPSKVVRFFSVSCLLLAVVTAGLGLACTLLGRQKVEQAVTGKRPALAERLQRVGYLEARSGVTLAVPLAAPPILLGLLGLAVASRRRWSEYHETPPSGLGFPVLLLLLGVAGVAGAVSLYRQPVPGRDLDDDSWKVRDLTDALDANEWDKCLTTEWSVPAGSAAAGLGSHFDNQKRCIEHYEKLDDLEKLAAAKWLDEPKLEAALAEKIALYKAPKPAEPAAAAVAPAAASEDIAEVQAKAKACFDKEKKKKPKLTVATSLSVEVSKAGKVVAVRDTGAGKPDAARKCAATQAKSLKLKAGEARKFDVPLAFP